MATSIISFSGLIFAKDEVTPAVTGTGRQEGACNSDNVFAGYVTTGAPPAVDLNA